MLPGTKTEIKEFYFSLIHFNTQSKSVSVISELNTNCNSHRKELIETHLVSVLSCLFPVIFSLSLQRLLLYNVTLAKVSGSTTPSSQGCKKMVQENLTKDK